MIHPDATIDECMQEISALEAEIERLRAENERKAELEQLRADIDFYLSAIGRLTIQRDDLYQRLSKYPAEMKRLHRQSGGDEIKLGLLGRPANGKRG